MEWQNFRQAKGQSVQSFTQEFRRRALVLGVDLYSQETLLKYITWVKKEVLAME